MPGLAESRPGPSTIASRTIASQWMQAMIGTSAARPSPPIGSGWYRRPRSAAGPCDPVSVDGYGLPETGTSAARPSPPIGSGRYRWRGRSEATDGTAAWGGRAFGKRNAASRVSVA